MFSAIGGFFGRMLGSEKAVEAGVNGIVNGFDKLVYTGEEKAEDRAKSVTEARQMLIAWMQATQGQNLARRILALVITSVWLLMYFISMALDLVSIWSEANLDNLQASADAIGSRATEMNGAMMLILGFYFAAPHMSGIVEAAMTKFSGKK